jgi:TPR repeat protein
MTILFVAMLLSASAKAPAKPPAPAQSKRTPVAQLQKQCNQGKGDSCDELGVRYRFGIDVKVDLLKAADLFKKACAAKDPEGCADDAFAIGLGEGVEANPGAALPRLKKQCDGGLARACGNLATLYYKELGGPENSKRAVDMWVDACKKGDLEACADVSERAHQDGENDRFSKFGHAACDYGDAQGCARMAELLGESNETLRAITEFAHACELGSVHGCTAQALLILQVDGDRKKAIGLLDWSCERSDIQACDLSRAAKAKAEPKKN